jgi:hypothetical protein
MHVINSIEFIHPTCQSYCTRILMRKQNKYIRRNNQLRVISNVKIMNTELNKQLLLKTWINIWSLLNTIVATIISLFIIVYIVIIYMSKKHLKKSFHVSLVLTCNTSLSVICFSITLSLMSLASIGGDHNIISLNQMVFSVCHFRGFLNYIFITSLYLSYVLQAVYRFFRIVYHKHKYLRTLSTFSCYIFAQWLLSFVLILPILFANKNYSSLIIYSPEDFNCLVPFNNIRGIVFVLLTVYVSPLCGLCLIYSRIIIHLQQKRKQPALHRQNKRDASVIKRIYTVIIILWGLCLPTTVFFIRFIVTGNLHWATYRICWMTISISLAFISLSSLYVTPQIYKKVRVICGCSKHHRKSYSIMERERKISENPTSNILNK